MSRDYKPMTDEELWEKLEHRFGDETRSVFEDKEKLRVAISKDDSLLEEYFDRISRGC